DALKALVCGANFVFFGRILQYAIAAAGNPGLEQLWRILSEEMSIAMAQTGMTCIKDAHQVR
ncbi:MAG: alpha-hydroxy-acid oxidizing protein, partial [Rhodobacterales bacterium]